MRTFTARAVSLLIGFMLLLGAILPAHSALAAEPANRAPQGDKLVYVVPVHQTIESGLQKFLERAFRDAEKHGAAAVILDIDTLGGRVDAALEIGELISASKVPTAAFVHHKAISAGSYIALNANKIVMEGGSSIGAAAVVEASGKEVESAKVIAFWAGEMRSAAELRGRNPVIAAGMVDKNIVVSLPQINRTFDKGELVSLTAEEALKVGYADKLAGTYEEVLPVLHLEGATLLQFEPTAAEKLARWLTSSYITPLLFLIGIAGIAIELFVPGFGVPGIVGILSFALYFFGHYVAGFAGVEDIMLFIVGIVLLVIEIFVPGFGIWAILGIAALVSGILMAAYDKSTTAASLGIAFFLAIIVVAIVASMFKHRGVWNKFILRDQLKTELGYTSSAPKDYLTGKTGRAVTPLRPAGTVLIEGHRVDVVTNGEFIPAGKTVVVEFVEGTRVVVKAMPELSE